MKILLRKSPKTLFYEYYREINKENNNLGFDYRNNLFKRSISNLFFKDEKREKILKRLEELIVHLIEEVKEIKKTFHYTIDKRSKNLN